MRLPAYPLITVDPFFSIWSRSEKLYEDDTMLWCGQKKRISATVSVDGKTYRFIGKGVQPAIEKSNSSFRIGRRCRRKLGILLSLRRKSRGRHGQKAQNKLRLFGQNGRFA